MTWRSLWWIITHPFQALLVLAFAIYIGAELEREQRRQSAP